MWEPLLGVLSEHYDCIVPDLLGLGRSAPAVGADLSSPGQALMLAQLLDALGIEQTAAVFHDQGGSHGGQMLKLHGQRISSVIFTNCVCYDNWPVPLISMIMKLRPLIKPLARSRLLQFSMRFYPWTMTSFRCKLPDAAVDDWHHALDSGGEALDHWIRYVGAQSPKWTMDAVPTLQAWDKPAHVIWAAQDPFLQPSWAALLARDLPLAGNPTLLPFASHFWQMEVPRTGAQAILDFLDTLD